MTLTLKFKSVTQRWNGLYLKSVTQRWDDIDLKSEAEMEWPLP